MNAFCHAHGGTLAFSPYVRNHDYVAALVVQLSEPTPAFAAIESALVCFAHVPPVRRNDYELGMYEDLLMDSERPDADHAGEICEFCLG